jgi:isopentenyl-diphosphate delta-isomerase
MSGSPGEPKERQKTVTDDRLRERIDTIRKRKEDGIVMCLEKPVQAKRAKTLLGDVNIIHNALPEMDFDEIRLDTTFLGHRFSAPFYIGAMTGGAELAKKINRNLAVAAQELGLGMVVGSQRAGLIAKELSDTYAVTRKAAPDIFIGSNIGGAQLSKGFTAEDTKKLVDMLQADALYVHLNPLQELVQPEGDTTYRNVLSRISDLAGRINTPIVAKEVGAGISGEAAKRLEDAGVAAIEVAGAGGTSWSGVEAYRAKEAGDGMRHNIGNLYWDWGIPTAVAVYTVRRSVKVPVVASGGLRTGLDVARAIILGADITAMAWPLLRPATISSDAVKEYIEEVLFGLKTAMFLTGSRNLAEFRKAKYVITGDLKEWIK